MGKLDEVPVRSFLLLCHFFVLRRKKKKPEITHTREETEINLTRTQIKKKRRIKKINKVPEKKTSTISSS